MISCPECGRAKTIVVETRSKEEYGLTRRRRCRHCHATFYTLETLIKDVPSLELRQRELLKEAETLTRNFVKQLEAYIRE